MPSQVVHTIKTKNSDFKYHFLKGLFLAGSRISEKTHPVNEVNELKDLLISKRKITRGKHGFVLKENIKVGLLMAYNLYSDSKKTEMENLSKSITLLNPYPELGDIFKGEIVSSGNELYINLNRKCVKLDSVWKFELNYDFLRGAEPSIFSESESFVSTLLLKHGFITSNFRHGITELDECDIVDESIKMQVEVTYAFKTELKDPKKIPKNDVERILTEFSDNRFIHPSRSLINKMSKTYTSKFKHYLAILMIGTPDSSFTLFLRLLDKLQKDGVEISPFCGYFLIAYDPMNDYLCISSTMDKNVIIDEDCGEFTLIKKELISYSEVNEDDKYLFILKDIFTDETQVSIFDKKQFDEYAKNLEIFL